jgi:carotenoid 1,2-hydratase
MLNLEIDEPTAPIPGRIRGRVRLYPTSLSTEDVALDDAGRHRWRPIAPCSRVEVELEQPALRWSGPGYLDSNAGAAPLEDDFAGWSWSRATTAEGRTAVLYDVAPRQGSGLSLGMSFDPTGDVARFDPPPWRDLPPTAWRIGRRTRADAGSEPKVLRTLESGPFYARSLLSTRIQGENATAVHESLSLDRFRSRVVQAMLPFRMPRWPL